MADWRKVAMALALTDGRIDEREAAILRRELFGDGRIDRGEVEFLLELHREAHGAARAFRETLFEALRAVMLRDGQIDAAETAWLRQFIRADHRVSDEELWFLRELQIHAREVCPEFAALVAECVERKESPAG